MANFIPPANVASLGSFSSQFFRKLGSKFITDRQINSLTPYTGVCGFKFKKMLTTYLFYFESEFD